MPVVSQTSLGLLCHETDNTGSNRSTDTSSRCALGARALRFFEQLLTRSSFDHWFALLVVNSETLC
jgi:hypothetical protein